MKIKYIKSSAIKYFKLGEGKILKIDGVDEAKKYKNVKEINFTKSVGDKVSRISNSSDRVGFVITQAEDVASAKRLVVELKILLVLKWRDKIMKVWIVSIGRSITNRW